MMNQSPEHFRAAWAALQLARFRALSATAAKSRNDKEAMIPVLVAQANLYLRRLRSLRKQEMQSVAVVVLRLASESPPLPLVPAGEVSAQLQSLGFTVCGPPRYRQVETWIIRDPLPKRRVK